MAEVIGILLKMDYIKMLLSLDALSFYGKFG